jgi:hypothetical protein
MISMANLSHSLFVVSNSEIEKWAAVQVGQAALVSFVCYFLLV